MDKTKKPLPPTGGPNDYDGTVSAASNARCHSSKTQNTFCFNKRDIKVRQYYIASFHP